MDIGLTNISENRKLFESVRKRSEEICSPLQAEDYVVQPIVDVSPPKWHLGHTTWFFETFILKPGLKNYREFDPSYNFVFNSYYETIGARVIRTDRGNLTRPTVEDVYSYRRYVNDALISLLESGLPDELLPVFELGINHEQQHQELLITDIKYILGNNPLFPVYSHTYSEKTQNKSVSTMLTVEEGVYEIGYTGNEFCFDNELSPHKVYLRKFQISDHLVTNGEYLEFMNAGGYQDFRWWHAEGWDWVNRHSVKAPLYWFKNENSWNCYTLNGLSELELNAPVIHICYYEASAFAAWKGMRLPTESEWEIASGKFNWGQRWEWTESAYLPYPGFIKAAGAIGEYNGKFMINQMVLRGASIATPPGHCRKTYRNFFHPHLRWQYTGIRLAA